MPGWIHLRRRDRRARCAPARPVVRIRRHRVVYRGPRWLLALAPAVAVAAVTAGALAGYLVVGGLVAMLVVVGWLGYALRVRRSVTAGPRGNGPAPPGGASVREPRRPLPVAPAGTAARLRDEEERPGQAVAVA